MRNVILITAIGFCLAVGTAHAKDLSRDSEVAAFQKLEQIVSEQVATGVSSKDQLLKARILEIRALYVNREWTQDQWLAREKKLNTELLQLQSAQVSQGRNAIDKVFEFQNWLLSTRELLKRNAGASK